MPTLTVTNTGKIIEAETGKSLLSILLSAGASILHKCDTKAECGSCHIFVTEGRKTLSKTQRLENEKLDGTVGVSSNSRLACQALMGTENITVELLA